MKFTGKKRKILIIFLVILTIIAAALIWWEISAYDPSSEALKYLESGKMVNVDRNGWISFQPQTGSEIGFILYPGAHVEPESYAPLAYNISQKGYQAFIVPMPLDLAIFGHGKASKVIGEYESVDKWIVGGHSLGGAMASRFADRNPEKIAGLVLLAAYPPEGDNLVNDEVEVLSIYGDRDSVLDKKKLIDRKNLLPIDLDFVIIKGGNHAQFGNYGKQGGDGTATISRTKQQDLTVEKIIDFIENKIE